MFWKLKMGFDKWGCSRLPRKRCLWGEVGEEGEDGLRNSGREEEGEEGDNGRRKFSGTATMADEKFQV